MAISSRWLVPLVLAALAVVGSQAQAQNPNARLLRPQIIPFPVNPNQYVAPNMTARQLGYNVATLGRALNPIPPVFFNSPISPAATIAAAGAPLYNPYALSTAGGYNPYAANAGGGGYGLSTAPGSDSGVGTGGIPGGAFGPWGWGNGMGVGDLGAGPGIGYGATLQGMAALTQATGQYWKDIQSARITREQAHQAAIETARRRIQFEAWYETVRPTAPKMLDAERATDIDRARKDPSDTDVFSARALNVLLKSAQAAGSSLPRGP